MSSFKDFVIRDTLSDVGQIPSTSGVAYYSPDIIPWGTGSASDPQATFGGNHFDTRYAQNLEARVENHVYARVTNQSDSNNTGQLYLYWSPSTLFPHPDQWQENKLVTADGHDSITFDSVAPGAKVVTPRSMIFTPPYQPDGFHYCLFARIASAAHPNTVPQNWTNETLVQWVVNNPGVAWHNVTVLNDTAANYYEQRFIFGNADDHQRDFFFAATYTGLPMGTVSRIVCSDPEIDDSKTLTKDPFTHTVPATLAGNFTGSVQLQLTLPSGTHWPTTTGNPWPEPPIHFNYYMLPDRGDSQFIQQIAIGPQLHGVPLADHGVTHSENLVHVGRCNVVTS